MPSIADVAKNNLLVGVNRLNVAVIYRGYMSADVDCAKSYQLARAIPETNMIPCAVGVTGFMDNTNNVTLSSFVAFINEIESKKILSGHDIRVLLFIGDWPHLVSYSYAGTSYIGFSDCFIFPEYAKWIYDGAGSYEFKVDKAFEGGQFAKANNKQLTGWPQRDFNYDSKIPLWDFWNAMRVQGQNFSEYWDINPCYTPNVVTNPYMVSHSSYVCFFIPRTAEIKARFGSFDNYFETVFLAPERNNRDWGTVLLSAGGGSNPTTRHALEEYLHENMTSTRIRYQGYTGANERGTYLFNSTRADNDAENYVKYQPGNALFSGNTVTDLFFWAPGGLSYQSKNFYPSSLNSNYGFRNGAICIFSQSWGALYGSAEYISPEAVTINTLAAQAIYTGVVRFLYANTNLGNAQRLFDISYSGPQSDNMTIAYSAGVITAAGTNASQAWTASAPAGANLKTIVDNIKTAISGKNWDFFTPGSYSNAIMSSAVWYFVNKNCAFCLGSTWEPYADGDPSTYALMTTCWYGGNMAEWALRMYTDKMPENCAVAEVPRYWAMYGDPLYKPFKSRLDGYVPNTKTIKFCKNQLTVATR